MCRAAIRNSSSSEGLRAHLGDDAGVYRRIVQAVRAASASASAASSARSLSSKCRCSCASALLSSCAWSGC